MSKQRKQDTQGYISRFVHLADMAAEAWLKTQTHLSYVPSSFLPKMIAACHADIALIEAHKSDMKNPADIRRANSTINSINQRIDRYRSIMTNTLKGDPVEV